MKEMGKVQFDLIGKLDFTEIAQDLANFHQEIHALMLENLEHGGRHMEGFEDLCEHILDCVNNVAGKANKMKELNEDLAERLDSVNKLEKIVEKILKEVKRMERRVDALEKRHIKQKELQQESSNKYS